MKRLLTFPVVAVILLTAPLAVAQADEEVQSRLELLEERLAQYEELILLLQSTLSDTNQQHADEIQRLRQEIASLQASQAGGRGPAYLAESEEEFDLRIGELVDDRMRRYTQGTGFLKGTPGDTLEKRMQDSLGYLRVGGELVTAGQVFAGLDPFDDRPNLQRVLTLARVSFEWDATDNLKGVMQGQFFGNFGASDTRFEDYYLVTPRSGTPFEVPFAAETTLFSLQARNRELVVEPKESEVFNDVFQLYQAYFQLDNLFELSGFDMGLRVGRQELRLGDNGIYGNEFLYGNNDKGDLFFGASLDGVKVMIADTKKDPSGRRDPDVQVDLWWYKPDELEETAFLEDDSSPSFWGVYGYYTGLEGNDLLARVGLNLRRFEMGWSLVRNPGTSDRERPSPLPFGMRNTLHGTPIWRNDPAQRFLDRTFSDVRLRESSEMATLSWYLNLEVLDRLNIEFNAAYQYGDTAETEINSALAVISPLDGFPINPGQIVLPSGDYDSFGTDVHLDLDLSDTPFDIRIDATKTNTSPHIGGGYAYFSGGTLDDYLAGDIKTFQRLVADRQYGEIMDRAPFGSFLSNVHIAEADLGFSITDNLSFSAAFFSYWVDQPTDPNGPFMGANPDLFQFRQSLIDDLVAFGPEGLDPTTLITPIQHSQRSPRTFLGMELDTMLAYNYNSNMSVYAGWSHFWDGDYFSDVLPDQNTFLRETFGDEFGSVFDVKGGHGQDYWYMQVKIEF